MRSILPLHIPVRNSLLRHIPTRSQDLDQLVSTYQYNVSKFARLVRRADRQIRRRAPMHLELAGLGQSPYADGAVINGHTYTIMEYRFYAGRRNPTYRNVGIDGVSVRYASPEAQIAFLTAKASIPSALNAAVRSRIARETARRVAEGQRIQRALAGDGRAGVGG